MQIRANDEPWNPPRGDGRRADAKRVLARTASLSVTAASCRLRRMSDREREAEKLQAVKGMNDILPPDSAKWSYVEKRARATFENHGYRELRTPVVEYTPL